MEKKIDNNGKTVQELESLINKQMQGATKAVIDQKIQKIQSIEIRIEFFGEPQRN